MLKLPRVQLVAVSSIRIDATIKALEYSCRGVEFSSAMLISHERPAVLPAHIRFAACQPLRSLDDYSYYMIYHLAQHIDSDYVLVIQSDGFVVNPASWHDVFLEYDYIGAPFPPPVDPNQYRDAFGRIFRVGNGGFSLRSRKLVELPLKFNLEWKPFHGFFNEDGFICAQYRHVYEECGMKFAPIEVAKFFSHESMIPEIQGVRPFGFHRWNGTNAQYPRFE